MKKGLDVLRKLLFPPRCVLCTEVLEVKRWKKTLCASCEEELPFLPAEKCPHCGGTTEEAGFCEACCKPFAFERACAVFPYGAVRESIHRFKYDGCKDFGTGLGEWMAEYLLRFHEDWLIQTDLLLPVPLHPKKERYRGFNQAALLSRAISQGAGLPLGKNVLYRTKNTVAQSLLSVEERRKNLKDVFEVRADVTGKRILLVDDVFTTGSTCNECARALYRAGAAEVRVFCLAAAGKDG